MPLLHKYDEPMSGISSVLLPAANVSLENTITYNPSLFAFDDKLILAPMQGLTSLFFRKAYHECFTGCIDYAISPFISLRFEAFSLLHDVHVSVNLHAHWIK